MTDVDATNLNALQLRKVENFAFEGIADETTLDIDCLPSSSHAPYFKGLKRSRNLLFKEGLDVLAHWSDGLFYLGVVVQVNELRQKCLVKFEDLSHYWCSFQHLKKAQS